MAALLPKRFDPELLVAPPNRLLEVGAADAAELESAGFVEPKRPPDEGCEKPLKVLEGAAVDAVS